MVHEKLGALLRQEEFDQFLREANDHCVAVNRQLRSKKVKKLKMLQAEKLPKYNHRGIGEYVICSGCTIFFLPTRIYR